MQSPKIGFHFGVKYAFSAFDSVGWSAGGHPVTCKILCPLILQCFDTVDWVRGRASHL